MITISFLVLIGLTLGSAFVGVILTLFVVGCHSSHHEKMARKGEVFRSAPFRTIYPDHRINSTAFSTAISRGVKKALEANSPKINRREV